MNKGKIYRAYQGDGSLGMFAVFILDRAVLSKAASTVAYQKNRPFDISAFND